MTNDYEEAAVVGASLMKKNAKAYYENNMTESADVLHAMARQLNEETSVDWKDLDSVDLFNPIGEQ